MFSKTLIMNYNRSPFVRQCYCPFLYPSFKTREKKSKDSTNGDRLGSTLLYDNLIVIYLCLKIKQKKRKESTKNGSLWIIKSILRKLNK